MPLRSPSRLPRRLNRPTSAYTRKLVAKRHRRHWRNKPSARKSHVLRRAARLARITRDEIILWSIILATTAVIGGVGVLLFSPLFDVTRITIRRQDARVDIEEMDDALRPLFNDRLFLVTKAQVSTLLMEKFPDITEVEIEKQYPSTLIVNVHFDRIVATLDVRAPDGAIPIGSEPAAGTGSGYSYVTSRGYVVTSPIRLIDADLTQFTIVDWGIRPAHGMPILDEEFIFRIFETRATLNDIFGLPATETIIFLRAREYHLNVHGVSLWFDLASPLQDHFGRFKSFLETMALDDVTEYVDLRLTDKVVYR